MWSYLSISKIDIRTMIDHVEEVIPGKSAKGFKNLTNNEWFFPKHFPGEPNMPGALQLESWHKC